LFNGKTSTAVHTTGQTSNSLATTQPDSTSTTPPPVAMVVPKTVDLGGQPVVDNYWWLRDKSNPDVLAYINAENAYSKAALDKIKPLSDKLFDEMDDRLPKENETVPYHYGNWWYSTSHGDDYPIYQRRFGSPTAKPQVIADVNILAKGHKFFDFVLGPVSDNGNLLLFETDVTGNRQYVLQVKDLQTGKVLGDTIKLADSPQWLTDNKTFYYVKQDDAKRDYRLYSHVVGTPVADDPLVYEEKDAQFGLTLLRTRDAKFLVLLCDSSTSSECRVLPADHVAEPTVVAPREADRKYDLDHRNGRFYIRVNDTSENFRVVTAPDTDPSPKNWKELVPARPEVAIDDIDAFAHNLVISERQNGLTQLAIAPLPAGDGDPAAAGEIVPKEIPFDEPDFTVAMGDNFEFDPPAVRFTYTSLTTPTRIIDYNFADGKQTLKKQDAVEGGFKSSDYHEERLWATAKDGTKIPISLVYRIWKDKGAPPSGKPMFPHAMFLEAYGSYGTSSDVYFSSERLSLLDRGMFYAVAHVRGGGEFGRKWYQGGRMQTKPNTFGDFIACAEFLENNGYTAPDRLAIYGASAGGLLIGAVVNQRPELFKAAIADVPWVDVLADMSDPSIPLTTLEYTEWGNPNKPQDRAMIASYDPYTNVRPQSYPAMLVRESLNDSQVQYWDATRWVAKLRAAKKQAGSAGRSELLFVMDMDAGHGGASGQDASMHEDAVNDAWVLTRLGLERKKE
jgi:oligopeptidase B